MKRFLTITIERVRRVIVREVIFARDPQWGAVPERRSLMKRLIRMLTFFISATLMAQAEPPFATGLRNPVKIVFTSQGNLMVAEAGNGPNTGRISLIDRTSGGRRTLIDGLPSGLFTVTTPPQPSGVSGLALQGSTLFVTIGSGDESVAGPVAGSEAVNPNPSSPILSALLSIRANRSFDVIAGNFTLARSQHDLLKSGSTVTLANSSGEQLDIRLIADFPNTVPAPRPDFADAVISSNPFGVAVIGQSLYVVDASLNFIRRVSVTEGSYATLSTFPRITNPTTIGPPQIDPVPDSIRVHGNRFLTTMLTGFPFPDGKAEVRSVDANTGAWTTVVAGLTSAIDVAPLGETPSSPLLVLEFSKNMLAQQPGRLRIVTPGGTPNAIAETLITPTSMVVDRVSGDVFITNLGPGIITRVRAASFLPPLAPTAVLPAIASTPGAFNSRFVTSAQISNPHGFAISGRIVFHPAGVSGQSSDPSLSYTLAPFETRSYTDLVAATGGNGLGSADVIASVGGTPAMVVQVTDQASARAPSLQMPLVDPSQALVFGSTGVLASPAEVTKNRFNIGIRSLEQGVTMTVTLYGGSAVVKSVSVSYPPNHFVQIPAGDLLGVSSGASQSLIFSVDSGSAIVYGATVDNSGAGMTLQIASPITD